MVFDEFTMVQWDTYLDFELQSYLQGNIYHVERDLLAFRIAVLSNRVTNAVVQREKELLMIKCRNEIDELNRKHSRDLADEKQKRTMNKANFRKTNLTSLHTLERQLTDVGNRIYEDVPRLEEAVDLQYIQLKSTKAPPWSRAPKKKILTPPPQDGYRGGCVDEKGQCYKSPRLDN
jgi:hypothetical protein